MNPFWNGMVVGFVIGVFSTFLGVGFLFVLLSNMVFGREKLRYRRRVKQPFEEKQNGMRSLWN